MINIRLIERTNMVEFDSLGRAWFGYDPDVTPEELWAHNRGRWNLRAAQVDTERWAAFNFRRKVVLVAELDKPGHETVLDKKPGTFKKALIGRPLPQGHPVHDALIGTEVEYFRNPVTYSPDPSVDPSLPVASDSPSSGGQGRQLDPRLRKLIEEAAQDRLMRHFRDDGWVVTDTRHNRPYDAEAVKESRRLYLEAKGTQSQGESVIVTRNEVDHARNNQGACVVGVWSGIRIVDDEVDTRSGDFRILDFNPDDEDLRPRDYDWRLPD